MDKKTLENIANKNCNSH